MAKDTQLHLEHDPTWPQDDPKIAQDEPKMGPRWPKMGTRWPQDAPKRAQDGPKTGPRWAQDAPKIGLKRPSKMEVEKGSAWVNDFDAWGSILGPSWRPIWAS